MINFSAAVIIKLFNV